ncbi:MAG: alkaline phosphatase family protein [Candidatus Limnocylindria bacterium]
MLLSYAVACLALAITAALLAGMTIDSLAALLVAGALLTALTVTTGLLSEWLLVPLPLVVVQITGLLVQVLALLGLGRLVPGLHVDTLVTAAWGAVVLTVLNGFLSELVAVSDDDSYYSALVRRLAARNRGRPIEKIPGLLVVQVDGLGLPVLENALRAGRVPVLGQLLRLEQMALAPWIAMLPSTTPASQAGILHGRNDGIAGFRWYEKPTDRMLVANHPDDAAEILRQISDGSGLLANDGASVGNLLTGDAPRSYLTMATITAAAVADDARRLRGFFVSTVNYVRLVVLMLGEIGKELYQAERQRGRLVVPRMHRDLHYAVERAITNIALRTISTALVIEEMYEGTPIIYVDYTGYDAISHHSGPERQEALDALEGIDRAIGSLTKAGRHAPRPYRLVVLSDHGQSLGSTFSQRYGQPLEAVVAALMPGVATVAGTAEPVEEVGMTRRLVAEIGRGSGVAPLVARHLPRRRTRTGPAGSGHGSAPSGPPDAVVAASGNLAHVYFPIRPGRMARMDIEALYPSLIDGLVRQPGVAALVVRVDGGGALVLGPKGTYDLRSGNSTGVDPLQTFGAGAAAALARLEGFSTSGDLILLGTFDHGSGEVTSFEELVGSHGGLGGWQTEPFILYPSEWTLDEDPPVGAPALYRQLRRWRTELSASGSADAEPDAAHGGELV